MKRLRVLGVLLLLAWWTVLLMPGAEAEAPEATGWWARGRTTPISLPVNTPNDYVPDTVPKYNNFGGTPLPQAVPSVPGQPTTVTTPSAPSPVPPGGLYVAAVNVRADGSLVPLAAIPDEVKSPDPRIPWPIPPQQTPEQVPQEAPSHEATTEVGVSALRLYVGNDAAAGDLVLEFDTEQGQIEKLGTVAIQACPPEIVWAPEEGGPYNSAPPANCSTGLAFGVDEGATPRIPVGGLVHEGMLDVVLMPQSGAAFHAVFKKPGPKSIEVMRFPPSDGSDGEDAPFFFELDCNCPLGDVPFLGSGGVGDLVVIPTPGLFTPEPPVAGRSRRVVVTDDGGLIGNTVSELEPWQKGVAAAVLAGLVTVYFFLVRPPGALPLALGPLGGRRRHDDADPPRGIGRFARPRLGTPPRL